MKRVPEGPGLFHECILRGSAPFPYLQIKTEMIKTDRILRLDKGNFVASRRLGITIEQSLRSLSMRFVENQSNFSPRSAIKLRFGYKKTRDNVITNRPYARELSVTVKTLSEFTLLLIENYVFMDAQIWLRLVTEYFNYSLGKSFFSSWKDVVRHLSELRNFCSPMC
jgi:hypothetical protein